MRITNSVTDSALLTELGERIARQRLNLNLTQAALATEAGISKRTLERIEAGHSTQSKHLIRVLRALGLGERLDALVPEPRPSPLAQLELEGRARERARPKSSEPAKPWSWGDDT